jgi:hypothetical protein
MVSAAHQVSLAPAGARIRQWPARLASRGLAVPDGTRTPAGGGLLQLEGVPDLTSTDTTARNASMLRSRPAPRHRSPPWPARSPDPAQGDEVSTSQNSSWNVSSTWGCVGVDTSRETTCPPAP